MDELAKMFKELKSGEEFQVTRYGDVIRIATGEKYRLDIEAEAYPVDDVANSFFQIANGVLAALGSPLKFHRPEPEVFYGPEGKTFSDADAKDHNTARECFCACFAGKSKDYNWLDAFYLVYKVGERAV